MFAARFFPKTYYAGRYFPPVDGSAPEETTDYPGYIIQLLVQGRMGCR
jgi:hypothetical protein